MSTPTQKHTQSRKNIRRGALALKRNDLTLCPQCKKPRRKHFACRHCGTYKGAKVIKIRVPKQFRKKAKREEKKAGKQDKGKDKKLT